MMGVCDYCKYYHEENHLHKYGWCDNVLTAKSAVNAEDSCSKFEPKEEKITINSRTEGEIKAYVEGYTKCYNDFTEYLKGRNSVADAIRKMNVLLTAVKAVLEQEDEK